MLARWSFNVKPVRDPKAESGLPFEGVEIAAGYAEIVKDVVTHTALVVGGVYCICKIVERLCR